VSATKDVALMKILTLVPKMSTEIGLIVNAILILVKVYAESLSSATVPRTGGTVTNALANATSYVKKAPA